MSIFDVASTNGVQSAATTVATSLVPKRQASGCGGPAEPWSDGVNREGGDHNNRDDGGYYWHGDDYFE